MSFSFGFSGDDIDDGGQVHDEDTLADDMSKHNLSDMDQDGSLAIPPKRHSLEELLASLPSQISYNTLAIPQPKTHSISGDTPSTTTTASAIPHVLRRSLFDIRAQLMAEADPETQDDQAETMLAGLESGDLTSGMYEGGFKTWECALDLASLVMTEDHLDLNNLDGDLEVIELGAGSAVPSLALLRTFLLKTSPESQQQADENNTDEARLKFTLCDYNEEVLRLCTGPNVLLNYYRFGCQDRLGEPGLDQGEGELDLEELGGQAFVRALLRDMDSRRVCFDFLISGEWGESFLNLISASEPHHVPVRRANLLILASETIYSPASSKIFADTLLGLLRRHGRGSAKAWVAAKKVYFGVGGGVDEFVRDVESRGGRSRILLETKDTGVGRVVLEVTI